MMRFKLFLYSLLFIGIAAKCYSQIEMDTDGLNNLNNVYLYSLKEYCGSLDSSKRKIVYVERNYFIGDSWPKEINGFKIIYLVSYQYKKIIKENGGTITLVGISPLGLEKGNFYVAVIPFAASYKKNVVHLSNGGGQIVNFQYDQGKKALIYKSKKWTGI
jgi:hypothetical protein